MTEPTNELIYEVLKKLQLDTADIKLALVDHTRQFLRLREDMAAVRDDINNLRRDDVRYESIQLQMDTRLERIETRLNLTDA